ncbi:HAD family hydrolase [Aquimarina agarivorans]|uniref:HAD family hydrolase n=1 Tax=Aquimarina agarivorans TaxID=980584 RepID=UPI000248E5C3|nr:HAD family phosphatase [Aquimarina agarivorans]
MNTQKIKNIIFDFGDIFINLDKPAPINAFLSLGLNAPLKDISLINDTYEIGKINTNTFLDTYQKWLPEVDTNEIIEAWNSILKDFPISRLEFLKTLAQQKKYKLFLLSNTNYLHIEWVKENVPFFDEFKRCFDKFYLSQEIGFRKPNAEIYEFVLQQNNLKANETLFIDDLKQNTDAAKALGIHVWNLIPGKEDVSQLFIKNPTIL